MASERRLIAGLLVAMFESVIAKNVPFRMSELMCFAESTSVQVDIFILVVFLLIFQLISFS